MSNPKAIRCTCYSAEHLILFDEDIDEDTQMPMAYVHVHLTKEPSFWKRLLHGIKYIFGYQCRYGAFDEIILEPSNTVELNNMLKKWHTSKKNNNNNK
jgi:hypothetical protein